MGEGLDKLGKFRPQGLADRILGFGDVVGLVKDFEQHIDQDEAEVDAKRMLQGEFTFADFLKQIEMIRKMGNLRSIFEKLPGMGELLEQIPPEALDDRELLKVKAMIQSMTRQERNHPDVLDASRMRRIAKGSGRPVEEVESLYERFQQTRAMMGQLGSGGMFNNLLGGGMPGMGGGSRARRRMAKKGAGAGMFGGMPGMDARDARDGRRPGPAGISVDEKLAAQRHGRKRKARKKNRKVNCSRDFSFSRRGRTQPCDSPAPCSAPSSPLAMTPRASDHSPSPRGGRPTSISRSRASRGCGWMVTC